MLLVLCPKIRRGDRDLQMALCDSMNACSVGGGETQTIPYAKKICLDFLHSQAGARASAMALVRTTW